MESTAVVVSAVAAVLDCTGGAGGAGGTACLAGAVPVWLVLCLSGWCCDCLAGAVDVECDGGAGAGGAASGNNLGLSGSTDGASSCAQNGPASPACATSDGGNGNGGAGAPGGIGGDVFGGTGADGASACESTDSCFNDNGP